ncbi:MAG: hypothetical protein PHO37_06695 [Kiritimatiellae bacterium]|nr:hypothetical protein [Kiritimatiellia bacterium]
MPYTVRGRVNRGAYESPFSGVGVEFYPVGVKPGRSEIILHESGYLPANSAWNFPSVFSPFWRLYYNSAPGHCVLYNDNIFELTPDKIMLIPDRRYFHCLGENPVSNLWMAFSFSEILLGEVPIPVLLPIRNTEQCLITDLMALISAA